MPNWLGDALFATPALRAVKKSLPDTHIACVAASRVAPVLANNPHVDELIVYDEESLVGSSADSMGLTRALKKETFDKAVFFHSSRTKSVIARLAGIQERIGARNPSKKVYLTKEVAVPDTLIHRIDYYLKLVEPLGAYADGRSMDYFPDGNAAGKLEKLLTAKGVGRGAPYAVLHVGGNWELKRWPLEYFKEWIKLFCRDYDWKVIVCGTGDEKGLAEELRASAPAGRVVSLAGETSLDELALLLKNAKIFLSNDSGPIHIAASQATPTLGLFGPTDTKVTGPVSTGLLKTLRIDAGCAVPCYFRSCNYRVCMEWLKPQMVFDESKKLIAGAA